MTWLRLGAVCLATWASVLRARTVERDWFSWLNRTTSETKINAYVYKLPPFNWLHPNCTHIESNENFKAYTSFKHSEDFWFARQANQLFRGVGDNEAPSSGTIFVIPALLNLYSASSHYKPTWKDWHAPWRSFCCDLGGKKTCHTDLVAELERRLGESRWFKRKGGKDHLLVASHFAWNHLDAKQRWPRLSSCSQINFEKYAATNAVSLPGLYIGKNCSAPSLVRKRLHSAAPPPGAGFHFIGDIGLSLRKAARAERQLLCDALATLPDGVLEASFCASSAYKKSVYPIKCDNVKIKVGCSLSTKPGVRYCDNRRENGVRTKAKCTPSPPTYCDALHKAAFVLLPSGDTASSNRLWDAINAGAVPIFIRYAQLKILPFQSVWRSVSLSMPKFPNTAPFTRFAECSKHCNDMGANARCKQCRCSGCEQCKLKFLIIKGVWCGPAEGAGAWPALEDGTPNPWKPDANRTAHNTSLSRLCKVKCAASASCVAFASRGASGQCWFRRSVAMFRPDAAFHCYAPIQRWCRDSTWLLHDIAARLRLLRKEGIKKWPELMKAMSRSVRMISWTDPNSVTLKAFVQLLSDKIFTEHTHK